MRKTVLFTLIGLIGLLLGLGVGGFLTYNRTVAELGSIPASPIVVGTVYDRENHTIVYAISNPGPVPLQLVDHTLVFTPGEETEEPAYVLTNVPVNMVLPPFTVTSVALDLKADTAELQVGDAVATTLAYTHPLSSDLYSVYHTQVISKEQLQGEGGSQQSAPAEQQTTPEPTPEATVTKEGQ